jgi:hypothetical protein
VLLRVRLLYWWRDWQHAGLVTLRMLYLIFVRLAAVDGAAGTLSAGARPASSQQDIPVATDSAVVGIIQLLNDGTIFPFDTTHDYSFVSLPGVSFGLGS